MKYSFCTLILLAAPGFGQVVTGTAKVRIDGKVETVRKINGRWWSQDNRQLTPTPQGYIWWMGTPKGHGFDFHHHRPVDLHSVESLRMWVSPDEVQKLLGGPNESAGREELGSRMWLYYAQNGVSVMARFTHDELSEAKYDGPGYPQGGKLVGSIEKELGGRSVFEVGAARAWLRNDPKAFAKFHPEGGGVAAIGLTPATAKAAVAAPAAAVPEASKRKVAADVAGQVKVGMARAEVTQLLGAASGGMRVSGGDSDIEDMSYALEPDGRISFHLENGKVTRIDR